MRDKGRVLFDTSVLVPAMLGAHEHHDRAVAWLERAMAGDPQLVVAGHALAECYATLTRLPPPFRVAPDRAVLLIRTNLVERARAAVIALTAKDYLAVVDDVGRRGIAGGMIYDALAVQAARRAGARILTFNRRLFSRLCRDPDRDLIDP